MFSLHPHVTEGLREHSGVCYIRILIPFMRTHDLITSQEPCLQYHHIGDEVSSSEFMGYINLQSTASLHAFMLPLIILAHTSHKQLVTKMINTNPFFWKILIHIDDATSYNFIFNKLIDVLFLLFFLAPNAKLILESYR